MNLTKKIKKPSKINYGQSFSEHIQNYKLIIILTNNIIKEILKICCYKIIIQFQFIELFNKEI